MTLMDGLICGHHEAIAADMSGRVILKACWGDGPLSLADHAAKCLNARDTTPSQA